MFAEARPSRLRSRPGFRQFLRDRSAIAALEFALVLPMLLAAGLGGGEVMRYLLIQKQVSKAAESAALMVAALDTPFRSNDEQFVREAMQIVVPFAHRDAVEQSRPWKEVLKVGVAAIRFDRVNPGCIADCETTPRVVWRTGERACGVMPYSPASNLTSVPSALAKSLGSLVVADVSYTYRSWFGSRFVPPLTVVRSNFQQPRYVDLVAASGNLSWICP
jgi:hypothetical protein